MATAMPDALALLGGASALGSADVPRRPTRDVIIERLAALIGSGALSIGDPLPSERDLAGMMGVSRETIRSALFVLAERGILRIAQGSRTTVASDDVGELALNAIMPARTDYELDDVHDARLLIEARVARLAALRIDARRLARLASLIEAQEATADPLRFLILDREFHGVIYRSCGNRVLGDLALRLYATLLDHRRRAVALPGAMARSIGDHHDILAALQARNAQAAAEAFGIHECRIYETTRQLMVGSGTTNTKGGNP